MSRRGAAIEAARVAKLAKEAEALDGLNTELAGVWAATWTGRQRRAEQDPLFQAEQPAHPHATSPCLAASTTTPGRTRDDHR